GTNRGMAYIDMSSSIQYYQMNEIIENTTFHFFEDKLYFGSVDGMYVLEKDASTPVKVKGFPNLVTDIFESDSMLIATDLSYAYEVRERRAYQMFYPPANFLIPMDKDKRTYVVGSQEGLSFFLKQSEWKLIGQDQESVKNVFDMIDYKGLLFGVSSSSGLFRYDQGEATFFELDGCNGLDTYKDTLVATADKRFYYYNIEEHNFRPFERLNRLLPDNYLRVENFYQEEDSTWIVYFNEQKILTGDIFVNGRLVEKLPLFNARMGENIEIHLQKNTLTISNGEDIFRYRTENNRSARSVESKASISSKQFHFSREVPYPDNKLRFDFTIHATYAGGDNYYRYYLDGYNDDWSGWSTQNYMEITNLFEGDYILQLEVRTPDRAVSTTSFNFSVLPPWYRTYYAYFAYLVLFGVVIVGFVKWRSRYLEDERSKLERLVSHRTTEIIAQKAVIEASLKEREVLLREIHHRVKNNLQVISSIFNMQLKEAKSEEVKKLINDGQSRMKTMSLIHQKLYQSEKLDAIEFEDYTQGLISQINQLYKKGNSNIECAVEAKGIQLDIDTAIPVGLMLNELLSNSYKYAFEDGKGHIAIKLSQSQKGKYLLSYCDNGKGFPADFDLTKTDSLGLRLVSILARQLRGNLDFSSSDGVCFFITFKAADV
ncbi:MAG: histidine kinase dimerization/phosphoacceptor domain -containing protein, partial [Bacteroidota bacterium]